MVGDLCWGFEIFESLSQLVDPLEALQRGVHVAGVAQVFEASWDHNVGSLVQSACHFIGAHVFNEFDLLLGRCECFAFSSAHHHDGNAAFDVELSQIVIVL